MRFISRSLTVAAAMAALSGAAFAQTAAPAPTAKAAASQKSAKAAKVTVISTSGSVSKFDAAGNMLTVTTPKGDVTFSVDSAASIMASGKKIAASDLANQVGHHVTVRYTESGGQKMAQSVRVTAAPKTASAKKSAPAKKS